MISIIIPCTNDHYKTHFLPQCLESIKNQVGNHQVIVAYFDVKKDNIIDIYNNAISKCKHEYYMLLGADDLLFENTLEILCKNIDGSDVIYGNIQLFDNRNEIHYYSQVNSINDFYPNNPIPFTSLIKKSAWEKIGGYKIDGFNNYPEDFVFWTRLFKNGAKFKYINEFIYKYRIHSDQASNFIYNQLPENWRDTLILPIINQKDENKHEKNIYYKINTNALGDCIAATPTLRKISNAYSTKINIVTHLPELFKNNPYAKNIYSFDEFANLSINKDDEVFESFLGAGNKNSVGIEKKHNTIDIRRFHSIDLGFDLIDNEMHYDFIPNEENNYKINQKYVCLHAVTSWDSRTYSKQNWQNLIDELEKLGYFIVIIGKNIVEHGFWDINKSIHELTFINGLNLSNKLNLSQLWHVLNNAEYVITMDSGILHFAGTTDTFIIQLGSSINNKLRAPFRKNSQDYKYKYISGPCKIFCASDMKYGVKEWKSIQGIPPLVKCLENKPFFECHSEVKDVINFIKSNSKINILSQLPKKYLFIAGHLSTGGGPKYLEWLIKKIKSEGNIVKVIEWNIYSQAYTVQRKEIINFIGENNFKSVGYYDEKDETFYSKEDSIKKYILEYNPDYIHLNDCPEAFAIKPMSKDFINFLYDQTRNYKIIETCHTSLFDFKNKIYIPDIFWFCSEYHLDLTKHINIEKKIVDMKLPQRIRPDRDEVLKTLGLDPEYYHVLQVGLFHKNKNQKYIFDIAKNFLDKKILFHFVGNLCYIDECEIDKNQKNCVIWDERDDVEKFMSCMDLFVMPSLNELNPISIKEALSWNMKCFISDLDVYRNQYIENSNVVFIKDNNLVDYLNSLNLISLTENKEENKFLVNFDDAVKIEILGDKKYKYLVKFKNKINDEIYYQTFLNSNMWASSSSCDSNNASIIIENLITKNKFEFDKKKDCRVCIINESGSLGDTIAWTAMVDSYAQEKNIKVDYYTPLKSLFLNQYENINFYDYSQKNECNKYNKQYKLEWFCERGDNTKNLQKVAADILGINFSEKKAKINLPRNLKNNFKKKYVCISIQSTAQYKYWNNPNGWQKTVDYLKALDYDVVCIDKDKYYGIPEKMNVIPAECIDKTGNLPLEDRVNDLYFCDFFIGLTSGLSWLAWSLNKPVVLISGISKDYLDFSTKYRVTNEKVCHGCAAEKGFIFDRSNWMFCPKNKNFECTTTITFDMVKEKIDKLILDIKK